MPVTIRSAFKPMTYDEIAKPLIQQTEAQMEIEDAYVEANDKAAQVMALANLTTDPVTYNKLKAYADDLKYQADLLAANGLKRVLSRGALLNMKRRYSNEIVPIEQAAARRKELADEQRAAMLKDLTLRFSTDFGTASLDDLVANPLMSYQSLSGAQVADAVGKTAANYAKAIMSDPQLSKVMLGLYWQVRQQRGYTPQQILMEAMNDPSAPSELRNLREAVHNQFKSNTAYNKDWMDSYINQGMTAAIGQTDINYDRNLGQMTAAEAAADQRARDQLNFLREESLRRHQLEEERLRLASQSPTDNDTWESIEGDDAHEVNLRTGVVRNKLNKSIVMTSTKSGSNGGVSLRQAGLLALDSSPFFIWGQDNPEFRQTFDRWDTWDEEVVSYSSLPENVQLVIVDNLPAGLTVNDIQVLKDLELVGPNRFKIVVKPSARAEIFMLN